MGAIDDEILRGAEEDAKEVAFIQNYMGVENRDLFTEEDIYYCLDVLLEYLDNLNENADELDALILLIDAELEYNEQLDS